MYNFYMPLFLQGTLSKFTDGEYFSGKGVGRVRLEPQPGMTVDILVTHTIASEDNHERREQQVGQHPFGLRHYH